MKLYVFNPDADMALGNNEKIIWRPLPSAVWLKTGFVADLVCPAG